jgi:regulator of extracellular matrix RemA (YlzA/DUF370 family)
MKNLNEPHRTGQPAGQPEGEIISLEERRGVASSEKSLIPKRQTEDMRERWKTIQASFVDEPRKAVQDADQLVKSAIQQMEEVFRNQRSQMEQQWSGGKDVSTEDLRLSLQRYRTFFDRLLSL